MQAYLTVCPSPFGGTRGPIGTDGAPINLTLNFRIPIMSVLTGGDELSVSRHLSAAKRKLQGIIFGGWFVRSSSLGGH